MKSEQDIGGLNFVSKVMSKRCFPVSKGAFWNS